jgi:hypothetical protein
VKKILFVLTCLFYANVCFSAVPFLINYSGKLTDKNGNPITGTKNIKFSMYDAETLGTEKWTGTYSVVVTKGVFNVLLGPFPSDLDFNINYWLEMVVDGETLTPRQRITSVAYAMRSEYSNRAEVVNTPMVYTGHGDIDSNVSERCYIHLEKVPRTVKMYLWGEKFNTQFYTELGAHTHTIQPHNHGHSATHTHGVGSPSGGSSVQLNGSPIGGYFYFISSDSPGPTDYCGVLTTDPTGASTISAGNTQKTYLNNMKVIINGDDRTTTILSKLAGWSNLGDGTEAHSINTTGTGVIDITDVITWGVGQHYIEFQHTSAGGGRVRYNIYVYY